MASVINPSGVVRNVSSGSGFTQAAIQNALNAAQPGDLVQLPPGSCTIKPTASGHNALTSKAGVSINGAGSNWQGGGINASQTTLVYNSSALKFPDQTPLLWIDAGINSQAAFSLSNINFQGQLNVINGANRSSWPSGGPLDMGVVIAGAARGALVFQNFFTLFTHAALAFWGAPSSVSAGRRLATAGTAGHAYAVVFKNYWYDNWQLNEGYCVEIYSGATSPTNDTWALTGAQITKATTQNGQYLYIEDNKMERFRHAVAISNGAVYVARYNTIINGYPNAAYADMHGLNPNWPAGGRWREFYNNTCGNEPAFNNQFGRPYGMTNARGGGGVCFNNTVRSGCAWPSWLCYFLIEGGTSGKNYPVPNQVGNPDQQYFWNNATGVSGNFTGQDSKFIVQDRDFYGPNGRPSSSLPGRPSLTTYLAYQYPHPLTVGGGTSAGKIWQGNATLSGLATAVIIPSQGKGQLIPASATLHGGV